MQVIFQHYVSRKVKPTFRLYHVKGMTIVAFLAFPKITFLRWPFLVQNENRHLPSADGPLFCRPAARGPCCFRDQDSAPIGMPLLSFCTESGHLQAEYLGEPRRLGWSIILQDRGEKLTQKSLYTDRHSHWQKSKTLFWKPSITHITSSAAFIQNAI